MGNRQVNDDLPQTGDETTDLGTLGIRLCEPMGKVVAVGSWLVIGTLVATDNLIEATPREGLMESQFEKLLAAATQVWLYGRMSLRGWVFRPELGWTVRVYARQPSDERRLTKSSRSCSEGLPPRTLVGSSRPLGR